MLGGTGLGTALRAELAQPMRAEMPDPGLAAPVLEPSAKAFGRVRVTIRSHQIDQVAGRCCADALTQRRQDRQFVRLDDPRTALDLAESQLPVTLHLWPEPDHVAAPYPCVEQEIECQPCLGAD